MELNLLKDKVRWVQLVVRKGIEQEKKVSKKQNSWSTALNLCPHTLGAIGMTLSKAYESKLVARSCSTPGHLLQFRWGCE